MSIRVVGVALFILTILLSPAHAARPEDDGFTGATLDTCRWFNWSNQATVNQSSGLQLHTSAISSFSSARVISQFMIGGDATMEVTVAAGSGFETPIPASVQLYAAFGLWVDDVNFLFIAVAKSLDRSVIRVLRASSSTGSPSFQNFQDIPISGSSARLRITKAAGQVALAYNIDGTWSTAATAADFGEGSYVSLQATTVGVQRQFAANFSNFAITSGATSYRQYVPGPQSRRRDFMSGGVVTDYIYQRIWGGQWHSVDPLQALRDNGMQWIRTGVTTVSVPNLSAIPASQWGSLPFQNAFWSSQEVVGQVLREAALRGLKSNLFLFLSNTAAHAGQQQAPPEWQGLSVYDTAAKLQEYTQRIVSAYRAQGINIDLYDVGNEIEFGILNFRPFDRIVVPSGIDILTNMAFMRNSVWPTEATLLKAAITGIRAADPSAKVVLHIAGLGNTPSDIQVKAFFKSMIDGGVVFDYAGLSHPYALGTWRLNEYSTNCWFQRMQETVDFIAGLGKQTIISEAAYPHDAAGMVASPMLDFPFSNPGQTSWVREQLRFGNNNPNVVGFMYFYPEMRPGASSDPSTTGLQSEGLFTASDQALPALLEFGNGALETQSDCLFRWAERSYVTLFAPADVPSQALPPYTFRYYSQTNAYLGTSSTDNHLYYLGPASGNTLLDAGPMVGWLTVAACQ